MKSRILRPLFILPILTLLVVACDNGIDPSSEISTVPYDLSDFSGITAENGCLLTLVADTAWSVEVTTNENFVQYLQVFVRDDALTIRLDPNRSYDGNKVFRATVHMPQLRALVLSAGSHADLGTGFRSTLAFAGVFSAGSSARGEMETGDFSIVLSAGSEIILAGGGINASIVASAGSHADFGNCTMNSGSVTASGGSTVTVNVLGVLNIDASGGSEVFYRGNPTLGSVNSSGGSTVKRIP
ncbi:MAG: DUF2807 domain-containing protein [Bacteroidetes bacterium]|nr:DUF2807 domain-containing protein [Bacteroidota bacterium]